MVRGIRHPLTKHLMNKCPNILYIVCICVCVCVFEVNFSVPVHCHAKTELSITCQVILCSLTQNKQSHTRSKTQFSCHFFLSLSLSLFNHSLTSLRHTHIHTRTRTQSHSHIKGLQSITVLLAVTSKGRSGSELPSLPTQIWFKPICLERWHVSTRSANAVWHLRWPTGMCLFSCSLTLRLVAAAHFLSDGGVWWSYE